MGEREDPGSHAPKRWVDDPADASPEMLRLLREAKPYRVPAGRRERVWQGLERLQTARRPRGARSGLFQRRTLPLVWVGVVALALGVAASARAHWLEGWVARTYHRFFARTEVVATSTHAPRVVKDAPAPPARELPPPGASSASGSPRPEAAALPATAPSAAARSTDLVSAHRRLRGGAARGPAREGDPDMAQLLAAARAIRVEHDAPRARALLARYLDQHPRGRFAEEALAMSVEAAALDHAPDASALAARYLALYPSGHFRETARRVRDGATVPRP